MEDQEKQPCADCPYRDAPPEWCPRWACSDGLKIMKCQNVPPRYLIVDDGKKKPKRG